MKSKPHYAYICGSDHISATNGYADKCNETDDLTYRGIGVNQIVHEMKRKNVYLLHTTIEDDWDKWVQRATRSGVEGWTNNAFLKENVPITIAV